MSKTIFVSGASGFIARHIVLNLLLVGYRVRGSTRTQAKADHVRQSIARHLGKSYDPAKLELVHLDLLRDEGWIETLKGADALIHTASPVPLTQPDNESELIEPAVQGTLRALNAAHQAGIKRVVLTSSVAAISGSGTDTIEARFDENDWTDMQQPGLSAYAKSKTLAEQAAWEFVEDKEIALTTINPSFVFGPALDDDFGASLSVIERIVKGRDPMLPRISFSIVDVRDVAQLHIAALSSQVVEGQRVIASAGQLWLMEIADVLRTIAPTHKIARRVAPNWLVRLLALWDKPLRFVVPSLGRRTIFHSTRCRVLLGRKPIPPEEAVRAAGKFMIENGFG